MQAPRSSTPTCLPKPCLKQLGKACPSPRPKHAHFPPPSEEVQRYSALDYDRSPIVVLVNECALPARGERTLDDLDEPKVRRHHHQHHPHSTKSASDDDDDERHTGFTTLATGAQMQTTLISKSGSGTGSVSMSSLIHPDSSDSDDGVALPIDGNGLQVYRQALSPGLDQNNSPYGAANSPSQSRRLRKSPPNRSHGRSASHEVRANRNNSDPSFALWSGSNSCLGGF